MVSLFFWIDMKNEEEVSIFDIISQKISDLFGNNKEFDDADVELINFYKDIIQARTIKYFTPEKLKIWNEKIDINDYISTKCPDGTRTLAKRAQFTLVSERLGRIKTNQVSMSLYKNSLFEGDDYF